MNGFQLLSEERLPQPKRLNVALDNLAVKSAKMLPSDKQTGMFAIASVYPYGCVIPVTQYRHQKGWTYWVADDVALYQSIRTEYDAAQAAEDAAMDAIEAELDRIANAPCPEFHLDSSGFVCVPDDDFYFLGVFDMPVEKCNRQKSLGRILGMAILVVDGVAYDATRTVHSWFDMDWTVRSLEVPPPPPARWGRFVWDEYEQAYIDPNEIED